MQLCVAANNTKKLSILIEDMITILLNTFKSLNGYFVMHLLTFLEYLILHSRFREDRYRLITCNGLFCVSARSPTHLQTLNIKKDDRFDTAGFSYN